MWVLIGIAVVMLGFAFRLNPLVVIAAAVASTGLAAGLTPFEIVAAFGKAFRENRFITAIWVFLTLIGVLEYEGVQHRARQVIAGIKAATAGRVLIVYLLLRQASSALGLTALGGQAQMVRPLIAPMAVAAAEQQNEALLSQADSDKIRAMAAATDNIGVFFGEDIFIAIGSILLIKGFLSSQKIEVEPLSLAVWAIPTAVAAFVIHGIRLWRMDHQSKRNVN